MVLEDRYAGSMPGVELSTVIAAPLQEVWDDVADLASHAEWMADAESITFQGHLSSGAGTTMRVETKVGPFRTTDLIEFTSWEPPHRMGVVHRGLVQGTGAFELEAHGDDATKFWWREELTFPWYFGGPIGARLALPVLRAVWRRNLRRLAERFNDR